MKIEFPEYNPPPVRKEYLSKKQREMADRLKKKKC